MLYTSDENPDQIPATSVKLGSGVEDHAMLSIFLGVDLVRRKCPAGPYKTLKKKQYA